MDRILLFAQSKAGIVIMALVSRPFRRIGD